MAEANKVVQLKPRAPKKAAVKKAAPKKVVAKKVAVKKTTAKKTVAKKTAIKKAPAKKVLAKKAAPKKITAKKTVTKKSAAKKAAPKKIATIKANAKKITTIKAIKKPVAKKPKIAAKKSAPKAAPKRTFKPQASVSSFKPLNLNPQTQETFTKTENIMTQGQAQFDQFTKDAANINREGIDAFVKSGTIFAKGFENLIKETMSFAQTTAEKQMQLAKDAMTCKTINEFSDMQNKLAKTGFDDFMSGTTKITELGVKVFSEAVEPINEQIQKSVQKATDAVAAE